MAQEQNRHAWLPDFLARCVVASGVGHVAGAYAVSHWLTRPAFAKLLQSPADHGLAWLPLDCRTDDGLRLAGWLVEPPRPRATVALFHGVRCNREQTLSRTAVLAAAGYRCVAFDFRAHGASGGRRTSFGYHERRDVAAVLRLARQSWPGQPCAALGISMGAAAVCFAAEEARACDAVVLESLYLDLEHAFDNRLRATYPPWLNRFRAGIVRFTERALGVSLTDIAPVRHIGRLAPAPVFFLSGAADAHAPAAEAEELFRHCGEPREFWLVPDAGHLDLVEADPARYRERVLGFLERHLFGRERRSSIAAAAEQTGDR